MKTRRGCEKSPISNTPSRTEELSMGKTKVQKPPIVMAAKSKNPMAFLKRDWQLYAMLLIQERIIFA